MNDPIHVAILDDHQAIIDGYLFRLVGAPDIQVVATLCYGEELEPALERQPVDVVILDVQVPTAANNPNAYPILYLIPRLLEKYPDIAILVISMHSQRTLVRAVMDAGANGYILKDDRAANLELAAIIRLVQGGGIYLSAQALKLLKSRPVEIESMLTQRQVEILSYCASYPEISTAQIALKLNIAQSTVRNLLSGAYMRLDVPNRAAAIAKARQTGLLPKD